MPSNKAKKEFHWEEGEKLTQDFYDPLGQVRDVGFTKLADGLLADPVERKKVRAKKFDRIIPKNKEEFLLEESETGLHEEYTPSEVSRLMDQRSKGFKGVSRFAKNPSSPGSKDQKK